MPIRFGAVWTTFVLLTIIVPPLLPAFAGLIPHRVGISFRNHMRGVRADFALGFLQSAFLVTFLAHQAWLMVDAILRTLFRLFLHRRNLLEWTTAAQAKQALGRDRRSLAAQVAASAAFAVFIGLIIAFIGYHAWYFATPFTILWVLSPLAAFLLLQGTETLALRVERHIANANRVIARR